MPGPEDNRNTSWRPGAPVVDEKLISFLIEQRAHADINSLASRLSVLLKVDAPEIWRLQKPLSFFSCDCC